MSKKFSPMRFTAATEEAAVEGALQLVGAARDEISYDFISQNAKGVTIRIRPFEEEVEAPEPESFADVDEAEEEAEAPLQIDSMNDFDDANDDSGNDSDDETAGDSDDVAAVGDDVDEEEENGDEEGETSEDELDFDAALELADDEYDSEDDDAEDSDDEDDDSSDEEELDDDEGPEFEVDAEMLERALTLARAMLDKMGLDAQVEGGRATAPDIVPVSIEGEDVGILIGKHGATLQSFQYLINLTLNHESESPLRVTVDAGNYRARRQESLEAVARGTASRVRRENRPIKMEPMPSNERRIVHDFLKTESGVSTQSEGREPRRCIIITPAEHGYRGASDDSRGGRGGRGMGNYGRGGRSGRNRR